MQPRLSGWAIALLLAECLLTLALSQPAFATGPAGTTAAWRLDDVLPERLSISLNFRARYEYLDEQFRITRSGDEELVVLRTLVDTRLRITDSPGLSLRRASAQSKEKRSDGLQTRGRSGSKLVDGLWASNRIQQRNSYAISSRVRSTPTSWITSTGTHIRRAFRMVSLTLTRSSRV